MSLLDRLIPRPRLAEIDQIDLEAPPEAVWAQIRYGDLAGSPWVRALFLIRTFKAEAASLRLDGFASTPEKPGFRILGEDPPREVAVGAIGQVWKADIPFVHLESAEAFAAFDREGFVKVAWAIRIAPRGAASHLEIEVRVDATDEASWRKFRRYFALIGIGSHFIRRSLLADLAHLFGRPGGRRDDWRDVLEGLGGAASIALAVSSPFRRGARSHWGLDPETAARPHPTDGLVPAPRWSWTHGIDIAAPASAVWPWVAQIGADRGGFYSYQWLENVAGCQLSNAETINPAWELRQGDTLSIHPGMPPIPIVACEPGRYFVAHAPPDEAARRDGKPWVAVSWLFLLEDLEGDRCRLISRYRADFSGDLASRLSWGAALLEPIGSTMDCRMLRGIRERAERRGASSSGAAVQKSPP